jgi:hypothetical protein
LFFTTKKKLSQKFFWDSFFAFAFEKTIVEVTLASASDSVAVIVSAAVFKVAISAK